MNTTIPQIEHKTYLNTFLAEVTLKVNYSAEVSDKFEIFHDFFMSKFNLELTHDIFAVLRFKDVRFDGGENGPWFKVSKDFVQIKVSGASYQNFENSIAPLADKFFSLIESIGGNVTKLGLQKINAWPVLPGSDASDIRKATEVVFRPHLTEHLPPQTDDSSTLMANRMENRGRDAVVFINFGFYNSPNRKDPKLILDTNAICESNSLLPLSKIRQTLKDMNQDLFDIYHWAVTDAVIELMSHDFSKDAPS